MICERCNKVTIAWRVSWFNTQNICLGCDDKERKHPKYEEARQAVYAQEKQGNRNYEGIGLPKDLEGEDNSEEIQEGTVVEFDAYGRKVVCDVTITTFLYDKSIAIVLDEEGEGPYGVATVCLHGSNLEKNQVIMDINNMSYAIEPLKRIGIIGKQPIRYIQSGFVRYPVYELTEKALKLIEE